MGGLKCPNESKMPRNQFPDFHVFGEAHPEVGAARNKTHKTLGKVYVFYFLASFKYYRFEAMRQS